MFGCVNTPYKPEMSLCNKNDSPSIKRELLSSALRQAHRWSKLKYGEQCVTCAEIYSVDENRFSLHITSPGELLINTSAVMEFQKSDAKLLDSGIYHSCHVKRIQK